MVHLHSHSVTTMHVPQSCHLVCALSLQPGQDITVVAVGAEYDSWEGFKDEASGETRIGLSYSRLCQDVKEGGRILLADGSVTIQVTGPLAACHSALRYCRLLPVHAHSVQPL